MNRTRIRKLKAREVAPWRRLQPARGCRRQPRLDLGGLLDIGPFALEDKLDEMVPQIRGFLERNLT